MCLPISSSSAKIMHNFFTICLLFPILYCAVDLCKSAGMWGDIMSQANE